MKIYKDIAVDFSIQNFGTAWLGILRGKNEDIELCFNGFFNFGATNGKLEYKDGCKTVATFWTNKSKMKRYFYNRRFIPSYNVECRRLAARTAWEARRWAIEQVALVLENQEHLINYNKVCEPEVYSCGVVSAEKPDLSLKEYLTIESFKTEAIEARFKFKKT